MINIMSPVFNYGFCCMSGLQKFSLSLITYSQLFTPLLFFLFSSYSFFIPPYSGYILSGSHMPSGKYSPNSICTYELDKPQLEPSKVKWNDFNIIVTFQLNFNISIYSVFIIKNFSHVAFRALHNLTIYHVYNIPTLISFMYYNF